MSNKFRNNSGELTKYSLSCGYIFKIDQDEKWLILWQEYGAYHVRLHDFKNKERILWEVFELDQLTAAKNLFYSKSKEYFNLSKKQSIAKACFL